ncbi:anhydro-N-acetylmuramic acid kinase [Lacimicrobium alkaliphilum]|uniref:Anhydro-N-acetylmuramic acid kinase n=1 Tax=Lacimicrobium alkaliphilum TaxID=1526571 RepID=A0ABQ1RLQ9_9ALTE|nr:anhydro-N-acetylmuramic acid kinase [Lacimicrobium alkaliphilum]GGD70634.1 anhydro-N-acetylmuramic acid kinase [Lacimicrobium alkaliphilum]
MHNHIQRLHQLASKPDRLIVGLMSGTSLDGLDVALCRISNAGLSSKIELLEFTTVDYDHTYRQRIKSVFSKRQVDLQQLCLLNPWIGTLHGNMVLRCLEQWGVRPEQVDLIASHGQTVYHAPKSEHQLENYPNATLQIGDGDHLACAAGIITLSDFRQKHLAAGGEGAPLAVYGDYLIFASPKQNRVMLNMGGIANLTYLPSSMDASAVFSTDVGPGNTLMDAYMQQHFNQNYDANAAVAGSGEVSGPLLKALQQNSFFALPFPKTTGPELFNLDYLARAQAASQTENLDHQDVMATLNQFSANMIALALKRCADKLGDYHLYASGGGYHNPLLMENIAKQVSAVPIHSTAELEIDPDAKEAVLFAVLANECVAGGKDKFSNINEGIPDITMGKVSFYD